MLQSVNATIVLEPRFGMLFRVFAVIQIMQNAKIVIQLVYGKQNNKYAVIKLILYVKAAQISRFIILSQRFAVD